MTEFEAACDSRIPFLGIVPPAADNPFPSSTVVWPSLAQAGDRLAIS
jgi:hypothetical protein